MPSSTFVSIQRAIHLVRGQRVMRDADLARLYGVQTKALNRAVKRHGQRFPVDFMFQLTAAEASLLRCQSGTSKATRGGRRYLPYVFTEHGVAMLSSVLTSSRAVAVNIEIIRTFIALRKASLAHADLAQRLLAIEADLARHATEFGQHKAETIRALQIVFETLKSLAAQPDPSDSPDRTVGFELQ